jgi:hypothetical protein
MALTINGCKLLPTSIAKELTFEESLKSGEDVVYFCELLSKYDLDFEVSREAIYYRLLKENSVSRQKISFDFNVQQRVEVIKKLSAISHQNQSKEIKSFIESKINAQTSFIREYITLYPQKFDEVKEYIQKSSIEEFSFYQLTKNIKKNLVISYCFTPYVDTSAIVMAKRIHASSEFTDVVYNRMEKVRDKSQELYDIADKHILNRYEIDTYSSFSNWKAIDAFTQESIKLLTTNYTNYKELYSRSLWPASHITAYEYKIRNRRTPWIAEFSDPILFDINGEERYSKIDTKWHFRKLKREIQREYGVTIESDNLFFWCECLPYVYADELIFTNKNQLEYMAESFPIEAIRESIYKKAVIKEHPSLETEYYSFVETSYKLVKEKINFAYFGTFYSTRKLNDIVESVLLLSEDERAKIVMHIFTNMQDDIRKSIKESGLEKNFIINDYVGYFEFLNISKKCDVLIINDAITKPQKSINPYLPSKLSDYAGSGSKIWAIYEEGSILSTKESISYRSELQNIEESRDVLKKIISEFEAE